MEFSLVPPARPRSAPGRKLESAGGTRLPALQTARKATASFEPIELDADLLATQTASMPPTPRGEGGSMPPTPRGRRLVERSQLTEVANERAAKRLGALTSSAGDAKADPLLRFRRKLQALDDTLARQKVAIEQTFDSVRDLLERASGGPDQYKGIVLADGVPRNGICSIGSYRYYKYVATEPCVGVRFSVRGAPSTPYLFVSTTTEYPSRETAMWYTKTGSSEGLTVLTGDPRFQATGPWYVALCSHSPSEYTLAANSILPLKEGVRRPSQVCSEAYRLFRFVLTDSGATLRVEKRAGGAPTDTEIFVSPSGPPTREHHAWRSGRTDAVALSPGEDPRFVAGPYYIACYGAAATDVPFSILVLTMQDLKSGVVCNGRVHEGAFRYFRLENTLPGAPIRFEMRCNVASASLYVSCKDQYPSKQSCTWLAGDAGLGHAPKSPPHGGSVMGVQPRTTVVVAIAINSSDPDYQNEGYYYVAVSTSATADFSICASVGGKRAMRSVHQPPPRARGAARLAPAEIEVERKLGTYRESVEEQVALQSRIEEARRARMRELTGGGRRDAVASNVQLAGDYFETRAERVPWSEVYEERGAVARARRLEREERERAEGERAIQRKENAAAIREVRARQRRWLAVAAAAGRARVFAVALLAARRAREEAAQREAAAARIGRFYRVKVARSEWRRHTAALYVVHRAMIRMVVTHRIRKKSESVRILRAMLVWLQNRDNVSGAVSRFVPAARECQRRLRAFSAVTAGRLEALERQWHRLLNTGPYAPPQPLAPSAPPLPASDAPTSAGRRASVAGRRPSLGGRRPSLSEARATAEPAAEGAPKASKANNPWTWDGGMDPLRALQLYEAAVRIPLEVRRALLRAFLSFQRHALARRLAELEALRESVRAGEALTTQGLFAMTLALPPAESNRRRPPIRRDLSRSMSMFHDRKEPPPARVGAKSMKVMGSVPVPEDSEVESEASASTAAATAAGGAAAAAGGPPGRRRSVAKGGAASRRKRRSVSLAVEPDAGSVEAEEAAAAAARTASESQRRAAEAAVAGATFVWQKAADAEAAERQGRPPAELLRLGPPRLRAFFTRQELMRTIECAVRAIAAIREEGGLAPTPSSASVPPTPSAAAAAAASP